MTSKYLVNSANKLVDAAKQLKLLHIEGKNAIAYDVLLHMETKIKFMRVELEELMKVKAQVEAIEQKRVRA